MSLCQRELRKFCVYYSKRLTVATCSCLVCYDSIGGGPLHCTECEKVRKLESVRLVTLLPQVDSCGHYWVVKHTSLNLKCGGLIYGRNRLAALRCFGSVLITSNYCVGKYVKIEKFNALNYFDSVCLLFEVRVLSIVSVKMYVRLS